MIDSNLYITAKRAAYKVLDPGVRACKADHIAKDAADAIGIASAVARGDNPRKTMKIAQPAAFDAAMKAIGR